jgi:quercetin dioxygenase-like cupin family protein
VRAGDVLWNPLSGEKAMLLESAEENGGARIVVDFAVEAGGFVPGGEHIHDHLSERLEVTDGEITFLLDGEERTVAAGEEARVLPGTWHRWWVTGDREVRIRATVEPALRFEEAILTVWGLCADKRTNAGGLPTPLFGALVATRYRKEIRYRTPPDPLQRLLLPPLAAVARRKGLETELERYLELRTHPSAEPGLGRLPESVMW